MATATLSGLPPPSSAHASWLQQHTALLRTQSPKCLVQQSTCAHIRVAFISHKTCNSNYGTAGSLYDTIHTRGLCNQHACVSSRPSAHSVSCSRSRMACMCWHEPPRVTLYLAAHIYRPQFRCVSYITTLHTHQAGRICGLGSSGCRRRLPCGGGGGSGPAISSSSAATAPSR